ncbi:MAG: haloacid dehalogenase-like hydrolase, partial [Verrucomicrobiota bacterium]
MNGRERGWALFDLDQTLVSWDMQAVWGNWVLRRQGWRRILLWPFLGLLPLAKVLGSGTMKRLFLGCCWAMERRDLEEVAEAFAERYVPAICYPDILEMLEKEKAAGRKTVLVSASPESYVGRMGARLGCDHAVGTVVDWGEEAVGWCPRLPKG